MKRETVPIVAANELNTRNILNSKLIQDLPIDSQFAIRKFLSSMSVSERVGARDITFKKRDLKLAEKERGGSVVDIGIQTLKRVEWNEAETYREPCWG